MPRGFQVPATSIMEGIIQLHHYVMFYLVLILFFVMSLLFLIFLEFKFFFFQKNYTTVLFRRELLRNSEFTHWGPLEFIWTLFPALVLVLVAFPSFSLLYAMDEVVAPSATLKVVGHQWYWSYDWSIGQSTFPEFDSLMLREEELIYVGGERSVWNFVRLHDYLLPLSDFFDLYTGYLVPGKGTLKQLFVWKYRLPIFPDDYEEAYAAYLKPQLERVGILRGFTLWGFINIPTHIYLYDYFPVLGRRLLETDVPLLFPVDTNVRVMVTADDVLHSWAVPSFGVKVDCVPGRLNQVHVTVNRLGHFFGQCSELCGVNHAQMPIEIFATDLDTFEKGAGVVKEKNILGL